MRLTRWDLRTRLHGLRLRGTRLLLRRTRCRGRCTRRMWWGRQSTRRGRSAWRWRFLRLLLGDGVLALGVEDDNGVVVVVVSGDIGCPYGRLADWRVETRALGGWRLVVLGVAQPVSFERLLVLAVDLVQALEHLLVKKVVVVHPIRAYGQGSELGQSYSAPPCS